MSTRRPLHVDEFFSNQGHSHPSRADGLELIVWLMDHAVRIPGTRIRLGLDALLGLIPLGGDFMTGLIQVGIVLVALARYRVPKVVAARMASNVLIDITVGAIPLLGDLFDVAFKANSRNLKLLRDFENDKAEGKNDVTRSSLRFIVVLVGVFALVLGLVFLGFVSLIAWLLGRPIF